MKFNDLIQNQAIRKGVGVASTLIACIAAVGEVINAEKKERELEEMKQKIEELELRGKED